MRFELGLSNLPDLTPEEAKVKLAGLPKGVSTGVIVKALQDGRLPSVAVAWSEDKRVINEIEDRLTSMGASCYVVDHAFFPIRFATWLAERMGAARYRVAEKEDRSFISLGEQKKRGPISDLARHILYIVLEVVVIEALFVWRLSLNVGATSMTVKWLIPQMAACAGGLTAGYVLTTSGYAWRKGHLKLHLAAPLMVLSLGCTVAALFHLKTEHESELAKRAVGRPPSNPFAGLLVELRRRQGDGSVLTDTELTPEEAALAAEAGELWCVDSSATGYLHECLAGPAWEGTLACLPLPLPPKVVWVPVVTPPKIVVAAPIAKAPPRRVILRPWHLRFELVHLSELLLFWMLSLVGLHFALKRRWAKLHPATPGQQEALATQGEAAQTADEAAPLHAEIAQLRAALQTAHSPHASHEGQRVQALERELSETQAALSAHRTAVAELRQHLIPARDLHQAQATEILKLKQALSQLMARVNAQGATPQVVERAPPANQQGTFRRPVASPIEHESAEHPSSYSVSAGQEERVSAPKRRP